MLDNVVIADPSCLISLTKIEGIGLLRQLYGEIAITEEIAVEFGENLPEWIKIEKVQNKKYLKILNFSLDMGEASAIALALEKNDVLLILDDLKDRKETEKLGFKITSTLGLLFKAKKQGLIPKLKPAIEKLKNHGFRISPKVENEILKLSDE